MTVWIDLQTARKVKSYLHIRSGNNIQGFTGGFNTLFINHAGNVFAETPLRTAGVTPDTPDIGDHHSRKIISYWWNWIRCLWKTKEIYIFEVHMPSVRRGDYERIVRSARTFQK